MVDTNPKDYSLKNVLLSSEVINYNSIDSSATIQTNGSNTSLFPQSLQAPIINKTFRGLSISQAEQLVYLNFSKNVI